MSDASENGRVALVTGGTSGIGRDAAVALARRGYKVVVTGRRQAEGDETVRLIKQAGGEGLFVQSDVSKEADVRQAVDATLEKFGRLDVAFNNAGIELFGPLVEASADDVRKVLDVNVLGVLLSVKHQVPAMLRTGGGGKTRPGGSIINNSSAAGSVGFPGAAAYAASKHAVNGITRSAALEFAKQGVRVNAVAPGAIQTEMFDRAFTSTGTDQRANVGAMHPVGRVGTPPEVTSAVLWLASDEASFVTGQVVGVDGGFTAG